MSARTKKVKSQQYLSEKTRGWCPSPTVINLRLRSRTQEQKQLAGSLEGQLQEKMASQSGEVKTLSEEAAALRSELEAVIEETQVCGIDSDLALLSVDHIFFSSVRFRIHSCIISAFIFSNSSSA